MIPLPPLAGLPQFWIVSDAAEVPLPGGSQGVNYLRLTRYNAGWAEHPSFSGAIPETDAAVILTDYRGGAMPKAPANFGYANNPTPAAAVQTGHPLPPEPAIGAPVPTLEFVVAAVKSITFLANASPGLLVALYVQPLQVPPQSGGGAVIAPGGYAGLGV